MSTESLGTSAVRVALEKIGRVSHYISEGEKEPSWDGTVYVHEDESLSKTNIKAIKVQVKTKSVNGKSKVKSIIKFRVEIRDLNNYQNNGGALYFVVYIDKDTKETLQIYYSAISPFKALQLLKNKRKQGTLSLPFKKFPENNDEKLSILLDYYRHVKMQDSFSIREPIPIDDLKRQGTLEGLTLFVHGIKNDTDIFSYPQIIENEEMFVYANIKGFPVLVPEEYLSSVSNVQLKTTFNNIISVEGISFYDKYDLIINKETIRFVFDDCLSFSFPNRKSDDWSAISFSYKSLGTLSKRLKTIDFIYRMAKSQSFEINNRKLLFRMDEKELHSKLDESHSFLNAINNSLVSLNVKKDLDLDQCTEDDLERLNTIIASVIEEKPVAINNMEFANVVSFHIANITLYMLCEEVGGNLYRFYNYFDKQIDVVENTEDGNKYPISQYAIMKREHFLSADNINYQAIINDVNRIEVNQKHLDWTNTLVLEMLHAFDENGNEELLDCCAVLTDYILSQSDENVKSFLRVNTLQIAYRKRALSFEEKKQLSELASNDPDLMAKAASFILLQEKEKAETVMKDFNEDQMRVFEQFPIYNLFTKQQDIQNE